MNAIVQHSGPAPVQFSMGDIEKVAMAIAKGGLFGSKDPNAVLTLCLLAQAEGQHPAVVFRDYHIINGKPAKKAEAMLRDFISAGGKIEWHTLTDDCADATFSHPGGGSARIEWTIKRAQNADLKSPMWRKYPRQMLRSRTISEGVRTVYPGATSGLYEENEVRDITAESGSAPTVVEGHFQERTVSPEQPTNSAPVETGYAFPDGPATGISQLKTMTRELWREIEGCGDDGELIGLLEMQENRALLGQLSNLENPTHREIWEGDGGDNPGLSGQINRKKTEFAQEKAAYLGAG